MNRVILLLLAPVVAAFAQERQGAFISEIVDEDGDQVILMETDWISMRLMPGIGSTVINFVFRPTQNDIVDLTQPKNLFGGGGLLQDNVWEQDWRFQELRGKWYDYQITKRGPVISGNIDIGVPIGTYGAFGAYAKGAPIRIIGAESTGEDAYWYVRADSPVKSMADMDGRTISFSTVGASTHSHVLGLIDKYKVNAKPVATGGFPATFTQVTRAAEASSFQASCARTCPVSRKPLF